MPHFPEQRDALHDEAYSVAPDMDLDRLTKTTLFDPRSATASDFEGKLWPGIIADRRDRRVRDLWNTIYRLDAEVLQFSPEGQVMVSFPDYSVRIDDMGDGAKLAFRLLLLLAELEKTILLVEESETHQHPESLRLLCDALVAGAKTQDLQLFVTTQSRECLRGLCSAASDSEVSLSAVHLTLSNGELETRSIPRDALEDIDRTGTDLRLIDQYG